MTQDMLLRLKQNNFTDYEGKVISFKIVAPLKDGVKSYFIEMTSKDFSYLKKFSWYRYMTYSMKYDSMIGHIYDFKLLNTIASDLIKLNELNILL